eukprot:1158969-Pelagomonas_calceolata.AAC.11
MCKGKQGAPPSGTSPEPRENEERRLGEACSQSACGPVCGWHRDGTPAQAEPGKAFRHTVTQLLQCLILCRQGCMLPLAP